MLDPDGVAEVASAGDGGGIPGLSPTGPLVAGDELYFDSYLDGVIESHGAVIAEIRAEVTDATGEPVITSVVTMFGEASSDAETNDQIAAIAARAMGVDRARTARLLLGTTRF